MLRAPVSNSGTTHASWSSAVRQCKHAAPLSTCWNSRDSCQWRGAPADCRGQYHGSRCHQHQIFTTADGKIVISFVIASAQSCLDFTTSNSSLSSGSALSYLPSICFACMESAEITALRLVAIPRGTGLKERMSVGSALRAASTVHVLARVS
jgi:hypothetical protein